MKTYATEQIRNIGLLAHGGAGKSSLAEAMLFHTGANTRIGKSDDSTSVMNYDPEEIKRKATISTALAALEWKNCKLNVLDTPGFDDFLGEVYKIAPAIDVAVVVLNASSGVEVGTEKNWKVLDKLNVPRVVFLSKLDKENLNIEKILDEAKNFDSKIVPIQIPWGTFTSLKGVIDLIEMKAYAYEDDQGKNVTVHEVPAEMREFAERLREPMIESIVECEDELLNKFFEGEQISSAELRRALQTGLSNNAIKPLLCGMSLKNIGTDLLLDFLVTCAPSPAARQYRTTDGKAIDVTVDGPPVAFVLKKRNEHAGDMIFVKAVSGKLEAGMELFNPNVDAGERLGALATMRGKSKIDLPQLVAGDIGVMNKPKISVRGHTLCEKSKPVIIDVLPLLEPKLTYAVNPRTKQDQEKMGTGLQTLCLDDGVLSYKFDPELSQGLLSGMGDTHIDVAISRLKTRWNVEVDISKPKIPFRETIKGKSRKQGKHKKQTGGRGQFGDVTIRFEPNPGEDFEFVDEVVGGVVPKNFIPAVEKGLQEARMRGVIAGFPTIGFKAILDFGSYHDVDSSELAFKLAATLAFKAGIAEAKPVLLEPIYEISVMVSDNFMGAVIGDLNSRRGRILGMEPQDDGTQLIKAHVPLAEMFKYATDLKSMTQSRADFSMKFDHYEEAPGNLTEQIAKEYGRQDDSDND